MYCPVSPSSNLQKSTRSLIGDVSIPLRTVPVLPLFPSSSRLWPGTPTYVFRIEIYWVLDPREHRGFLGAGNCILRSFRLSTYLLSLDLESEWQHLYPKVTESKGWLIFYHEDIKIRRRRILTNLPSHSLSSNRLLFPKQRFYQVSRQSKSPRYLRSKIPNCVKGPDVTSHVILLFFLARS